MRSVVPINNGQTSQTQATSIEYHLGYIRITIICYCFKILKVEILHYHKISFNKLNMRCPTFVINTIVWSYQRSVFNAFSPLISS
jgi:hypothetical protein